MAKYIKKPVAIDAIQWTGENASEIEKFIGGKGSVSPSGQLVRIDTDYGIMTAVITDWIIKGVKGEFYPCPGDVFRATYDAVGA